MDVNTRKRAMASVDKQIRHNILPQLRSLRRTFIGSVDEHLSVFPPQRVYNRDRRAWPRITSESQDFVLCHNDLGPQNIFVHCDTFQILPLWTAHSWEDEQQIYKKADALELAFFGLEPKDLNDCQPPL
ncbi:hypothetical protein SPBR_09145 [Sporothrix brasiliensis 5110]|uniref:Aminoglycoside phosphotransferase domain-containing protein n=1 Tax=Sporothrix brasiliensis 5110 TaxID=1398154 RepID=A0A0C2FME8_9PEZI|nr:uncharacterized protein SPBR_09145 [Sporothrix brasiliensis 5110]KIH92228.1 hypothetical protein SPBR_09145 [Sporothrix brasiliensis 5110]